MRVITVARKPVEGTVAKNALKYGTGGLNIDASRIITSEDLNGGAYGPGRSGPLPGDLRIGASLGMFEPGRKAGGYAQPAGRWPANVIVQHRPECQRVGSKKVRGSHSMGQCEDKTYDPSGVVYGWGQSERSTSQDHVGEDGLETTEAWECVEGCPALHLDRQTGVLRSGSVKPGYMRNSSTQPSNGGYHGKFGDAELTGFGDEGGASRFFKQVSTKPASRLQREDKQVKR